MENPPHIHTKKLHLSNYHSQCTSTIFQFQGDNPIPISASKHMLTCMWHTYIIKWSEASEYLHNLVIL
jgi:hypothetical protein